MKKIHELLQEKGFEVWSVAPGDPVYNAIERMAEHEVGALAVCEDSRLVGMISERDYARKVILVGKASKETLVREIMTAKVVVIDDQMRVDECMALMTVKKVRHLPVLDGQDIIGMISLGDLVKDIIIEQSLTISQLENYIRG